MRSFTLYHLYGRSFAFQQEKLIPIIVETAKPDIIFLLGGSLYRRRSESIFCPTAPSSLHTSDYFLLVLLNDLSRYELHEWQDKIERHCKAVMPITCIVLQTSTFTEWLKAGDGFANTVRSSGALIYSRGNLELPDTVETNNLMRGKELELQYRDGLNKAKEFMAGAELFKVRQQNRMAAFMLHQSSEQALRTLIRIGTGFRSCTHNIGRLIRYASLVAYELPDIFSHKDDRNIHLFNLLQKAYIEGRYNENYKISNSDLLDLTDRVSRINGLLATKGESILGSSTGAIQPFTQ
jgi:HEPN domain-containing protein